VVLTDLANSSGQDRIAEQTLGFLLFTSIDVRFACITCGIDQKGGLVLAEPSSQMIDIGVIDFFPGETECPPPLVLDSANEM
jgi:hypothetical protein